MTQPSNHRPSVDQSACQAARLALDGARTGDETAHHAMSDSAGAALADARSHVEGCRACQAVVRNNEVFDRQVGRVLRDVAIPDDLRQRLLATLAEARAELQATGPETAAVATVTPLKGRSPRRRFLKLAAVATCVAFVVGGTWFARYRPLQKLSNDEWTQLAISDDVSAEALPVLEALADGSQPVAPATMSTRYLADYPRGLAEGRGALYFFQFPARRGGGTVQGRLLVVPARWFEVPPEAKAFLARPAVYLGQKICMSSWIEGDFCYICVVKGGGGENELHTLAPRPVAT